MSPNQWAVLKDIAKDIAAPLGTVIAAIGTVFAAVVAANAYRRNSKTRRAEFVCQLHKSFFEDETHKRVRKILDSEDKLAVAAFVAEESEDFINFVNFFQLVAYLFSNKNLVYKDLESLLGYYLSLFLKSSALQNYIRTNGFKKLDDLLGIMVKKRKQRRS